MSDLRIAIILGSTRPVRKGEPIAHWVHEQAQGREARYDLLDLADFALPVLDEPKSASGGEYEHEHTKRWSAAVAPYDGYIFITPEYNRSYSGALKNAIDYLYQEWNNKAVAFVGYGARGGFRAVEHLRSLAAELQLADIRLQLAFSLMTDFENFSVFKPGEQQAKLAADMFDQLESWAGALKPLRG